MLTTKYEDHIVTLSRRLKDAEQKSRAASAAGTSSFVLATGATISFVMATLDVTPTLLPTPTTGASHELSPTSARDDVASVLPTTRIPITSNAALEYMDVADANNHVIHLHHLHILSYILNSSDCEAITKECFLCRWPDEWTEKAE